MSAVIDFAGEAGGAAACVPCACRAAHCIATGPRAVLARCPRRSWHSRGGRWRSPFMNNGVPSMCLSARALSIVPRRRSMRSCPMRGAAVPPHEQCTACRRSVRQHVNAATGDAIRSMPDLNSCGHSEPGLELEDHETERAGQMHVLPSPHHSRHLQPACCWLNDCEKAKLDWPATSSPTAR
jgi:hypothetical protein